MSVPAYKRHLNLPPIDSLNKSDVKRSPTKTAAIQSASFNVFDASPTFRSILDHTNRHRSQHRPARLACESPERVPLSRSVSPQRRTAVKPSGKPWEQWEPEKIIGPAPEPVRVDPPPTMETITEQDKHNPKRLVDFQTRARVCRRAGRDQAEAGAQYNVGLLYEAGHDVTSALAAYKRHLEISSEKGNDISKALACNSIGSIYQKEGDLQTALHYHHMHAECADLAGKFVAHTNLGCVYAALGQISTAMKHHQHALRYAIKMESQTSQAIAINNLGITGGSSGDLYTAKACMERFLELSSDSHNTVATGIAYSHLADIALMSSDLAQAQILYNQARHVARITGNRNAFAHASIQIGVVVGQNNFDEHMSKIQNNIEKELELNDTPIIRSG